MRLDEVPILLGVVSVDAFVVYAVTWWLGWFRSSQGVVEHRETLWSVWGGSTPVIATGAAVILLFLDHTIASTSSRWRRGLLLATCTVIALLCGWFGWARSAGFEGNGVRYHPLAAAKVGSVALWVFLVAAWLRCLIRAIAPPQWDPRS